MKMIRVHLPSCEYRLLLVIEFICLGVTFNIIHFSVPIGLQLVLVKVNLRY